MWMCKILPLVLGLCPLEVQQCVLGDQVAHGSCCASVTSPLAFFGQRVKVSAPWPHLLA